MHFSIILLALHAIGVSGDGIGLIGWGKNLYIPTCAFACRGVIKKQTLSCTPAASHENFGTAHNPVSTPPSCFVTDAVFLKTMALCIDVYCGLAGETDSQGGDIMELIEDYWATHIGTGTIGTTKYTPVMRYDEALEMARVDEMAADGSSNETDHSHVRLRRQHGHPTLVTSGGMEVFGVSSPLPNAAGGSAVLNVTSFVPPTAWQMQYNYMSDFEINETGHSTMTVTIAIVAILLPILLSALRFIPVLKRSNSWTYLKSRIIYPAAWGNKHRESVATITIPTRGQTLYIALISFLNAILLVAPYTINQPQSSFTTRNAQELSIIGNRAGVLAMGNVVALFLFACRNSVLIWVTDWSYGTYLLLHRWLGYWAIFHTVLHSVMLLAYYASKNSYAAESVRLYWAWGMVGTVAAVAILPFSVLWVRRKFYDAFLASHIVLSLFLLLGYYYHIWFLYTYNWGYEIWMFIAGAIWGVERLIRLGRMAWQRSCTAVVTRIDDEYLRIDIQDRVFDGGVLYLCFPGVGWRFWESHPFSVAFSTVEESESGRSSSVENAMPQISTEKESATAAAATLPSPPTGNDTTTFLVSVRSGFTAQLAARVSTENPTARLRVLLEGPYHHSGHPSAGSTDSILCIAGGVGITACLPYLLACSRSTDIKKSDNGKTRNKLFWSARTPSLVNELTPTLARLQETAVFETKVGQRLDLEAVLRAAFLSGDHDYGALLIVVCGPPGMADAVRNIVAGLSKEVMGRRRFEFVDEAYSW